MKKLIAFAVFVHLSWQAVNNSYAEAISNEARNTLNATNGVLYKMAGWNNEKTKLVLEKRLDNNKPLLETISQDGFKEMDLESVNSFVKFTDKVFNEQSALVFMANFLSQMAVEEGLSYDEILAKRRFLMEEWTYCMQDKNLSKGQISSLLNRMLYFGLNAKYKAEAELAYHESQGYEISNPRLKIPLYAGFFMGLFFNL